MTNVARYTRCGTLCGLMTEAKAGMPVAEAQGLLTRRQWREGDIARLQTAAAWLGVRVPVARGDDD
jgi:hypothetical protein